MAQVYNLREDALRASHDLLEASATDRSDFPARHNPHLVPKNERGQLNSQQEYRSFTPALQSLSFLYTFSFRRENSYIARKKKGERRCRKGWQWHYFCAPCSIPSVDGNDTMGSSQHQQSLPLSDDGILGGKKECAPSPRLS